MVLEITRIDGRMKNTSLPRRSFVFGVPDRGCHQYPGSKFAHGRVNEVYRTSYIIQQANDASHSRHVYPKDLGTIWNLVEHAGGVL